MAEARDRYLHHHGMGDYPDMFPPTYYYVHCILAEMGAKQENYFPLYHIRKHSQRIAAAGADPGGIVV